MMPIYKTAVVILGVLSLSLPVIAEPIVILDAAQNESLDFGADFNLDGWNDLSGSANHGSVLNGSLTLEQGSSAPNGIQGVDFGGAGNHLQLLDAGASDSLMNFAGPATDGFAVLLVVRPNNRIGDWNDIIGNHSNTASGYGMRFGSGGVLQAYCMGAVVQKDGLTPVNPNTTFVIATNYNAHTGAFEFYDSINDHTGTSNVTAANFSNSLPLNLGYSNDASRYLDGAVYEVVVFDRALSDLQFQAEQTKLKTKWLIDVSSMPVPVVHLDALDSSINTTGNIIVESWGDLTGNGYDATQIGEAVIYESDAQLSGSGLAGLSFGTGNSANSLRVMTAAQQDEFLDFNGLASDHTGFAVVVAFKPSSVHSEWSDLLGNESGFPPTGNGFAMRYSPTGQPAVTLGGADLRGPKNLPMNETIVYSFNYDSLNQLAQFWDSYSNTTTLGNALAAGDFSGSGLLLGRSNNESRYFNGAIYEVKMFQKALSDDELKRERQTMLNRWRGLELPVEVLGVEGITKERGIYLTQAQVDSARKLWLQINNLSYQNKGSVSINNAPWVRLNHDTVDLYTPEARRGGMVHGGYNTVRLTMPIAPGDLKAGWNTIRFRFNQSDAISMGFRVVNLNLVDDHDSQMLPESRFFEEDPKNWVAPYSDAASIALGEELWGKRNSLASSYKADGQTGWWYGHVLPAPEPIKASCMDCHTQDGRDLEMFSYSNESIIQRSVYHELSEEDGKLIASYIRSLSDKYPEVGRYGRPWNPPYQPGPEVAEKPVEQWAAGAGLDAVLDRDEDMAEYLFPDGVTEQSVNELFDADKYMDHSTIPLAIQLPDWKHWLPMIHPMDAFSRNGYYDNPTPLRDGVPADVKTSMANFREIVEGMKANGVHFHTLIGNYLYLHGEFRSFVTTGDIYTNSGGLESGAAHWRTKWGDANFKGLQIGGDTTYDASTHSGYRQFATTSLARLLAVKNFEFHNELNIQGRSADYINPEDDQLPRTWISREYNVFEVPAHFNAPLNAGRHYNGQSRETGEYETTAWYQLQAVLNAGYGQNSHNAPVDYNYVPNFILDASARSRLYEPMRYFMMLNTSYQTKSWSGGTNPNDGQGFRMRQQSPIHAINMNEEGVSGIGGANQGFVPGFFLDRLDLIEPGMGNWVMNAHLELFLSQVEHPNNALSGWWRHDEAENWEQNLDPISVTTYTPPLTESFGRTTTTPIGNWAHKTWYMVLVYSERGADPSKIDRLIDWGKAAWPNFSDGATTWDDLRNRSRATAVLAKVDGGYSLVIHNGGSNPVAEWYVNDVRLDLPSNTTFVPDSYVAAGDTIKAVVTSNASTIPVANRVATETYTEPKSSITLSKNPSNGRLLVDDGETINFQILPIEGALMWLDANNVVDGDEPAHGDPVPLWENIVGDGYDASAPNASYNPTYNADAFEGRPGIRFGANDYDAYALFDATEDDVLDGDFTLFIVNNYIDNGSGKNVQVIGNRDFFANDSVTFGFKVEEWHHAERFAFSAGGENSIVPHHTLDESVYRIVRSGLRLECYHNGVMISSLNLEPGHTVSNPYGYPTMLGIAHPHATGQYYTGNFGELILYDRALEKSEMLLVEGYLSNKWFDGGTTDDYTDGDPVTLTITHPDGSLSEVDSSDFANYQMQFNYGSGDSAYSFSFNGGGAQQMNFDVFRRMSYGTHVAELGLPSLSPSGDYDGDGVSNYIEYITGSNPADRRDRHVHSNLIFGESSVGYELPIRIDDDSFYFEIQASDDLRTWSDKNLIYTFDYQNGSTESVKVEYPEKSERLFFRLMVEENP